MYPLNIVPYREIDHDSLIDLWFRSVSHTHHFLTEDKIAFYRQVVSEALPIVEVWEAVNDRDEPIGFIGLDGPQVEMLFVDPRFHGQGTGKRLLNHAVSLKGDRLKVDVNEQNDGARAFYLKYGFEPYDRSELDGSGNPFPILHLRLPSRSVISE